MEASGVKPPFHHRPIWVALAGLLVDVVLFLLGTGFTPLFFLGAAVGIALAVLSGAAAIRRRSIFGLTLSLVALLATGPNVAASVVCLECAYGACYEPVD